MKNKKTEKLRLYMQTVKITKIKVSIFEIALTNKKINVTFKTK